MARNPALALQHNALKRSLKLSQEALVWLRNSKRGEKSKSFQKLGPQVDGLLALDVARRSLSEENDLRMLRVSSSYQLRHTSDTTEDLDENCTMRLKNAKDPQQFDFALALQGYKLGAHYRGISEDADSQRQFLEWTRTLSFAASERSVS